MPKQPVLYDRAMFIPGAIFNELTLKEITRPNGKLMWACECVCGNYVVAREDRIALNITRSCGCKSLSRKNGSDHHLWKGCGGLDGSYMSMVKNNANTRGHEFNITAEYAWNLFIQQDHRCAMSGRVITITTRRQKALGLEQTASIDRIDSSKGYVEGNVWWVHKDINFMKQEYPLDYFVGLCKDIVNHYGKSTSHATRTVV